MSHEQLLPCPFCGDAPVRSEAVGDRSRRPFYVSCVNDCACFDGATQDDADARWNQRPAGFTRAADQGWVAVPIAGLSRIEWAYDEHCTDLWCPACHNGKECNGGHRPDCWILAALPPPPEKGVGG